ncbi:MAG TPA: hypothetical protein VL326_08025 [Kofleriaceae bacterium]|jgi:hypothetical protein|nr:hypothetical protein [Kofleriaceae bacterium]
MRSVLTALLVGATLATVVISAHAQFDQLAHQATINRNQSAEVLKFHAVLQARLDVALSQPDMPEMATPPKSTKVWTVPAVERDRVS